MKKTWIIAIISSVMVIACHNSPKNTNRGGYTLNGTINGLDSGWVYLGHYDSTGYIKDSTPIKDHKFVFTGKVPGPMLYDLTLNANRTIGYVFDFFIEDTVMQITVDKDSAKNNIVIGSHTEEEYLQYSNALKPIEDEYTSLRKLYFDARSKGNNATIDSIMKVADSNSEKRKKAIITYAEKNQASIISAWAVNQFLMYDEKDIKIAAELYKKFPSQIETSYYGMKLKKKLEREEMFQEGKLPPGINENDTSGKPISLSSLKGKYVLIDFWASWCNPCRRENPNVVAAYKKYKNKNFTVYSVSLDHDKADWEKAIKEDGLTWYHVSDLKEWNDSAAIKYGVRAIPFNVLIDKEGKILAHNLRGDDLEKTLSTVIK